MDVYRLEVKLPFNSSRSLEKLRLEFQAKSGKKISKSELAKTIIEACLNRLIIKENTNA